MLFEALAFACTAIFAGAALYVSLVEHPARLAIPASAALAEFGPSYRRGAVMQGGLAVAGCASAIAAFAGGRGASVLAAGLLLGSLVPFTLLVILPTNRKLLDPALNAGSPEAGMLLRRWGRLHAVRAIASALAFFLLLSELLAGEPP